ncbi:hypothetical protein JG687_00016928 [Phytophthora cactorum]|uniref:Uncharacterized protein n=1 Tax=Phytophthora cactorum TaxID=29920 RepID=A0A8T1TR38_9STRA|nr:hypothetical protein JG687_00016928 [Phytophthora cactorum]
MLPNLSVPKRLVDHWFHYFGGRFERNIMFVATLFNQRQRHSIVRKAARVGVTHSRALAKLSDLANNSSFQEVLRHAKLNSGKRKSQRLNAQLLHVLSVFGSEAPFSPFQVAHVECPNTAIWVGSSSGVYCPT